MTIDWAEALSGPSVAGFVSLIVFFLGFKYYKYQRKIHFRERKLNEFYSPLFSCVCEVRALDKAIEKINTAANDAWQELCKTWQEEGRVGERPQFDPFAEVIATNNKSYTESFELYKKMYRIFTENMSLADEEIMKWYEELAAYIEVWSRLREDKVPALVLLKLEEHTEDLKPFFEIVESKVLSLRKEFQ